MYETAAIVAAVLLIYSVLSGRIARSRLSGPIVFMGCGFALGPYGMGILDIAISGAELKGFAEAALAMVLFSDAAHADLAVVRRGLVLPERLLLIGLPLTIVLGFAAALALFPALDVFAAALLATLLAPTDAALGAPVISNHAVPAQTREALNLESGLNDGICVPIVVILLDFAVGTELRHDTIRHVVLVVVEEIGIGMLVGLLLTAATVWLLRLARLHDLMSPHWRQIAPIALAALCFATAQALGGSGFIASFVAGLLFGYLQREAEDTLGGAESAGEVLAMLTWLAFGGPILARLLGQMTASMVLYAVLSLTVIRMLPVFLSLLGTTNSTGEKLFIGWFGPRGLATVVFAVIVFDSDMPGSEAIVVAAACAVLLSVIAHGATANVLIPLLRSGNGAPPGGQPGRL
jgi:NhaP-type Na+/H+ or K+/H+ antiporter